MSTRRGRAPAARDLGYGRADLSCRSGAPGLSLSAQWGLVASTSAGPLSRFRHRRPRAVSNSTWTLRAGVCLAARTPPRGWLDVSVQVVLTGAAAQDISDSVWSSFTLTVRSDGVSRAIKQTDAMARLPPMTKAARKP